MKKKSDLSRLMGYAGNHRYFSYASWLFTATSALLALVPYWYIWKIIGEVLAVAPDFSRAENLATYGWLAVLFTALSLLLYVAGMVCSHLAALRVSTNIRCGLLRHIVKLPQGQVEDFGSGKLRKIINESSAAAETYLSHQLPDMAGAIATPCGLLVLLFVFDWRLGLLSLIPVVLGFLVMMGLFGSDMEQKMKMFQNSLEDISNEAVEYVRGIPVVKTFGQTIFSFRKFKAAIDHYGSWVTDYTIGFRTPLLWYTVAINSVFAFLVAGALFLTRNGVTDQFLLNLLFYIIITPVIALTLTRIMYQEENFMIVGDAMRRIDSVLDLNPLPQPQQFKTPGGSSIEIENISFSYDGKKDVLQNISLSIQPGQKVALVGPSGSGKTTLAGLITRFFDPQQGSIRIGGVNIADISKDTLMDTVSFVFQNSKMIKASILDNVRMGKPEAGREEVMAALLAAQCMDIIEKFPEGIDTVIGTKGVYLSGGEQQRIAIARVMLKDTPIVILDEATAFADPDNESRIQAAFNTLSRGKTVLMIAHRLSTIIHADRIFVLEDGKISESGTSHDLMESGGVFSRMWKEYQTSIQWKVAREAGK